MLPKKAQNTSLEKLIDTVSSAIGSKYGSKIGQSKLASESDNNQMPEDLAALVNIDSQNEIFDKIRHRIVQQEVNRQLNIDNIIDKAAEFLDENVSEEPVDNEWRTKYFSKAQDVSTDQLQEIWAKILAGEVAKPGAVSLRTLEIISNLSKAEAEIFEKLASLSLESGNILKIKSSGSFDEFGINFENLLTLRAANLVFDSDSLVLHFNPVSELDGATIMKIGNNLKKIFKANTQKYSFGQISLTPAGKELKQILNITANQSYFDKFIETKISEGFTISDLTIEDLLKLAAKTNPNN